MEEFRNELQQNLHILKYIWFSDEAYLHFTETSTDTTCFSCAFSIHIKFTNPLCKPRKVMGQPDNISAVREAGRTKDLSDKCEMASLSRTELWVKLGEAKNE